MHEPCLTFEAGLVSRWADRQELSIVSLARASELGRAVWNLTTMRCPLQKPRLRFFLLTGTHTNPCARARSTWFDQSRRPNTAIHLDDFGKCVMKLLFLRPKPRLHFQVFPRNRSGLIREPQRWAWSTFERLRYALHWRYILSNKPEHELITRPSC